MSKDRKKLIHIHSNVYDKQPKSDALEYGELAVNYSDNMSFISTKKNNGSVVRFSDDDTLVDWMERKAVFPYKGEVEETNLTDNKSRINFTFNQKVARNTPHHDDALNGFSVDMSKYAMIGGNPTFNVIKATSIINPNGNVEIHREPSTNLSSDTVNAALEEVLEKSKVTAEKDEESKLVTFFQNNEEIVKINLNDGLSSIVKNGDGNNSAVLVGDTQKANGEYSFSEGQHTVANNRSEHAFGEYNKSNKIDDSFGNEGNTLFSIGNGTSESDRKNAFEVMQNGDIYIYVKGERVCLNDILASLNQKY